MRMRKKKNLDGRMARCAQLHITDPFVHLGKWHEVFGNKNPIQLEIGCGKGTFITTLARENPDVNFIGVEKVPDCLVLAMEKTADQPLSNLKFLSCDAALLAEIFAPGEIDRIFLNFSDPWPKKKQAKRRLTHCGFLAIYREILKERGEIHFKTDNRPLFDFSLEEFPAGGFHMQNLTYDLHAAPCPWNIMTEYEQRFVELGQPIHRVEAVKE